GPGFSRAWHPFSVASCRFNPVMRLLIKSVGKDTAHLQDLHAGDEMRIHGPFVEFHVRHEQDQVWIAGGVGVAPFLGMVRCLDFRGSGEIRLIQYEGAEEPALESELREFQARHPQFRSQTIVTSKADFHELGGLLANLNNPVFLVCGPPSFMRAVRKSLVKLGIQSSHIHTEEFSPW
ncbi:MAG: FAD-dependent oxidoreductase, partial [Spirochaetia bacterium]|nr:FAD-dependent oxidoreductase [Spirochaetia bacterium]